ncbi:MAG: hypothetical protein WCO90_12040 [Planctomycetota bacterium]|jgi:hypothetical protein
MWFSSLAVRCGAGGLGELGWLGSLGDGLGGVKRPVANGIVRWRGVASHFNRHRPLDSWL